jgi:hypothetical protein
VNLLVDYVISIGLKPDGRPPGPHAAGACAGAVDALTDEADFTGRSSFYGQQADAFRACLIDGESLALIQPGPTLQIQILASEFLDYSHDNAVDILNGIQYDAEGRRQGIGCTRNCRLNR